MPSVEVAAHVSSILHVDVFLEPKLDEYKNLSIVVQKEVERFLLNELRSIAYRVVRIVGRRYEVGNESIPEALELVFYFCGGIDERSYFFSIHSQNGTCHISRLGVRDLVG